MSAPDPSSESGHDSTDHDIMLFAKLFVVSQRRPHGEHAPIST